MKLNCESKHRDLTLQMQSGLLSLLHSRCSLCTYNQTQMSVFNSSVFRAGVKTFKITSVLAAGIVIDSGLQTEIKPALEISTLY